MLGLSLIEMLYPWVIIFNEKYLFELTMAIKDILIWPDDRLKEISKPIIDFDEELKNIIKDLSDTMDAYGPMAGLSAPQIGILKRVFILDIPPEDNEGNGTNGKEVFINPEIITKEGSFSWSEGCMSIPGLRGQVKRHDKVRLRYQDQNSLIHERDAHYYLSGGFQHELDHLNGILWVDYQSPLKKKFIKKKMLKYKDLTAQEQQGWRE
jgi:peptide deformylase